MSHLLKSVIQDLINDRSEQAQVTLHQYLVQRMQETMGINEANASNIQAGIKKLADNFMFKADKFMPDVQEWEAGLPKNPSLDDFKVEAKNYFDDFYPRHAEGDEKLNDMIVNQHFDALLDAIAKNLQKNHEAGR